MSTPVEACAVCKARQAGLAPPKRKCTCESGFTSQRHSVSTVQSSSRSSKPQEREQTRVLGLPPDLVDMEDTYGFKDMVFSDGEVISVYDKTEESSDYWAFHEDVIQASESGDVAAVRSLLEGSVVANLVTRFEDSMQWTRREALGIACANGSVSLVSLWLDDGGLQLSDRCFDPPRGDSDPYNVGATPLRIAAGHGHSELVRMLIARGADAGAAASDGTTPCYAACQHGSVDVLRLLHTCGVDLAQSDEDGTAPVHIAAARGNLDALKFLHEHGVNIEARGAIYLDTGEDEASQLHSSVTPLMITQSCAKRRKGFNVEVLRFLDACASSQQPVKRQRASISTYDRAVSLGVAHRLHEIPASLQRCIESGSDADIAAAKKEIHKLQKANQKIVSRAEEQRLKQTRLAFAKQ